MTKATKWNSWRKFPSIQYYHYLSHMYCAFSNVSASSATLVCIRVVCNLFTTAVVQFKTKVEKFEMIVFFYVPTAGRISAPAHGSIGAKSRKTNVRRKVRQTGKMLPSACNELCFLLTDRFLSPHQTIQNLFFNHLCPPLVTIATSKVDKMFLNNTFWQFSCRSSLELDVFLLISIKSIQNGVRCRNLGLIFHLMASGWQFSFRTLFRASTTLSWTLLLPWQHKWCHSIWSLSAFRKS